MNMPATNGEDKAATAGMAKLIRGVGIAEFIFGFLCLAAAGILGPSVLKRCFPEGVPIWTSLASPMTLRYLGLLWTLLASVFVLFWHGGLCTRRARPLRPIGFSIGVLVALKFTSGLIALVAIRLAFDSVTVTVNGNTENLGNLVGIYADFLICAEAVLVLLAVSLTVFCGSKETKKALESLDQSRYQMDAIPLSVFIGIVLFIYLAYSSFASVISPTVPFAGFDFPPLLQRVMLLLLSGGFILTAVAFYRGRSWGWVAALLLGLAWTAIQFRPTVDASQLSGPEFDKIRDFVPLAELLMRRLVLLGYAFTVINLALLIGYLLYVRRHLTDKPYESTYLKSSKSDVSLYINRHSLERVGMSFVIMGALGGMQWSIHDYFSAILFFILAIMWVLLAGISFVVPRYTFRDAGLAIPGFSLLATPVIPYESFKSVRFITTRKAPKGIRSIEHGVLNLNVSMFDATRRVELENEFRKRGVEILPTLLQSP